MCYYLNAHFQVQRVNDGSSAFLRNVSINVFPYKVQETRRLLPECSPHTPPPPPKKKKHEKKVIPCMLTYKVGQFFMRSTLFDFIHINRKPVHFRQRSTSDFSLSAFTNLTNPYNVTIQTFHTLFFFKTKTHRVRNHVNFQHFKS